MTMPVKFWEFSDDFTRVTLRDEDGRELRIETQTPNVVLTQRLHETRPMGQWRNYTVGYPNAEAVEVGGHRFVMALTADVWRWVNADAR